MAQVELFIPDQIKTHIAKNILRIRDVTQKQK